jgi:hypothetical protein
MGVMSTWSEVGLAAFPAFAACLDAPLAPDLAALRVSVDPAAQVVDGRRPGRPS